MSEDRLLTPAEVSALLRVPVRTLENWRRDRRGPRFGRFGSRVLYRESDVQAFVDAAFHAWDDWQAS